MWVGGAQLKWLNLCIYIPYQIVSFINHFEIVVINRIFYNLVDKTRILGTGQFSQVFKGRLNKKPGYRDPKIKVAIKTSNPHFTSGVSILETESEILSGLPNHDNIVGLLGTYREQDELYTLLEYCRNGPLVSYLQNLKGEKNKNETGYLLKQWKLDILNGMIFLSSKKVTPS